MYSTPSILNASPVSFTHSHSHRDTQPFESVPFSSPLRGASSIGISAVRVKNLRSHHFLDTLIARTEDWCGFFGDPFKEQ